MNFASRLLLIPLAAILSLSGPVVSKAEVVELDVVSRHCGGCHQQKVGLKQSWSRISEQRKSPEGWAMTIDRMLQLGRIFTNREETRALIKVLSDGFGLTPEESLPYRYALTHAPNTPEKLDDPSLVAHCGRCHSGARVALQRRTLAEWQLLGHFHIGQYPSTEYSGSGRENDIYDLFTRELPEKLVEMYPLDMQAWSNWQVTEKPQLAGNWSLVGHQPGRGDFSGVMSVSMVEKDRFSLIFDGKFQDGKTLQGTGTAVVYAGFEWRGSINADGKTYRQVLAHDGQQLSGRMFLNHQSEIGMQIRAVPMDGTTRLLAVSPDHIRTGARVKLTLSGTDLKGKISLGPGVKVRRVLSRDSHRIVLWAKASKRAKEGRRLVKVGQALLADQLTVFKSIAAVKLVPEYAIARVGDNGGSLAAVRATFEALAMTAGKDGIANTEDDLRVGYVPATWSVKPFDEQAEHDLDVQFAGTMDPVTGIFIPGAAGPNPERKFSTNNAGNLGVVARVRDGKRELVAEGQLIVTVQRWINPLIR